MIMMMMVVVVVVVGIVIEIVIVMMMRRIKVSKMVNFLLWSKWFTLYILVSLKQRRNA